MRSNARRGLLLVALWAATVAGGLWTRPAWPIDETRYLGVAWEMWSGGDLLVPHLNGAPYSDKPPLLFWLIVAGWRVLGVQEWWARLVPALFALGSLFLTASLARRLWPERPAVAEAAPLVILSTFLWSFYTPVLLFDMLLVFFALLGILGLVRAARRDRGGWLLTAAATALGILAKGPAILLWLVPAAITAPLWSPAVAAHPRSWYARLLGTFAGGIALALAWAIPASISGGRAYGDAILWNQTAGRMTQAFAHRQPFWWYVPYAPLLALPWLLWPRVWRRLPALRTLTRDLGIRLCAVWVISGFTAFSLVSGKSIHYLLPLVPALALVVAVLVTGSDDAPSRRGELVGISACFFILGGVIAAAPFLSSSLELPSWVENLPPGVGVAVTSLGVLLLLVRPRTPPAGLPVIAACSVAVMVLVIGAIGRSATPRYDVRRVGQYIGRLEREGHPLAHVGKYRGEYHFAGRLKRPIELIERDDVERWFSRRPDGYVVVYSPGSADHGRNHEFRQAYRGGVIAVRRRGRSVLSPQ